MSEHFLRQVLILTRSFPTKWTRGIFWRGDGLELALHRASQHFFPPRSVPLLLVNDITIQAEGGQVKVLALISQLENSQFQRSWISRPIGWLVRQIKLASPGDPLLNCHPWRIRWGGCSAHLIHPCGIWSVDTLRNHTIKPIFLVRPGPERWQWRGQQLLTPVSSRRPHAGPGLSVDSFSLRPRPCDGLDFCPHKQWAYSECSCQ